MARVAGLLLVIVVLAGTILPMTPAHALSDATLEKGEQIFSANCAACHMGGGNVIRASRTLKIADLKAHVDEYGQDPLEALEHEIEDGLNAMPAYAGKLSEEEIIAVASYVEKRAEVGW
mgnify:FL=1